MRKIAYVIRVITVAPIMALVLLLVLYLQAPQTFGSAFHFLMVVFFLVVLPLLAYPLQPLIKKYKGKGREGQRTLALIFAVAGYIIGFVSAIVFGAPSDVLAIYLAYMISGLLVALANKVFHFKASGHACGVTGPFMLLVYFGQSIGYIGIGFFAIALLASLYMKRHTWPQLLVGSVIPFAALTVILLLPFG
jgi:hypothetical protein